jgi:glycosyltransferase involved in cell wall biosynthesis
MKIGFDAKRLFCNFTGLGNYSRTLVANLAKFYPNHGYHLYSPSLRKQAKTAPFFKAPYQAFAPKAMFKSLWRSFSIPKQLQKDQIELYHGLSHELPIGIQKSKLKSIVTIHDLIFKVYPETYSFFDRQIYDWKFRYSCQKADRIIAISEHTKQDIVRYYKIDPKKIEVIYQACQGLYYTLNDASTVEALLQQYQLPERYILSVGTLQERKNIKLLIKAYQHLPKTQQLPIVIVGNGGSYKEEVQELIQKMNLEGLVFWITDLESDQSLQALYQKATLLVYPSFYEGFGLPVVEALLSKTPVITANTSALKEAGGPHSLYVSPTDEKALANAIQQILDKPELTQAMCEKGYEYAHETFHPKKLSIQLMACYQQTISSK